MEKYLDKELTEKIGLESFKITVLKEINKSVEVLRKDILTSEGWAYELSNRYYDFYVKGKHKYKWNLKEKIKTTDDKLTLDQNKYLKQIPFLEYEQTNLKIQFNGEWKNVIQTKTHLILT